MSNKKNKVETETVSIYNETDFEKDQEKFEKSIKTGKLDLSSFQRLMMHDLCANTGIIESGRIGDISLKDIDLALRYPKQGWKILLRLSEELMRI